MADEILPMKDIQQFNFNQLCSDLVPPDTLGQQQGTLCLGLRDPQHITSNTAILPYKESDLWVTI